jgi:hypothetical protein
VTLKKKQPYEARCFFNLQFFLYDQVEELYFQKKNHILEILCLILEKNI